MHIIEVVIGVVWVGLGLYWLLAAVAGRAQHIWSPRFLVVRAAVAVVVIFLLRTSILKRHTGMVANPWLEAVGLALFLLGIGFAVWARVYLGNNWGVPMSEKRDPELVTTGPYRYVRNPIYTGLILALSGTALAINLYLFIAVAILAAYFIYSATVEERTMRDHFPTTYPAYRSSTKMLIPFLL